MVYFHQTHVSSLSLAEMLIHAVTRSLPFKNTDKFPCPLLFLFLVLCGYTGGGGVTCSKVSTIPEKSYMYTVYILFSCGRIN